MQADWVKSCCSPQLSSGRKNKFWQLINLNHKVNARLSLYLCDQGGYDVILYHNVYDLATKSTALVNSSPSHFLNLLF